MRLVSNFSDRINVLLPKAEIFRQIKTGEIILQVTWLGFVSESRLAFSSDLLIHKILSKNVLTEAEFKAVESVMIDLAKQIVKAKGVEA